MEPEPAVWSSGMEPEPEYGAAVWSRIVLFPAPDRDIVYPKPWRSGPSSSGMEPDTSFSESGQGYNIS